MDEAESSDSDRSQYIIINQIWIALVTEIMTICNSFPSL